MTILQGILQKGHDRIKKQILEISTQHEIQKNGSRFHFQKKKMQVE